MRVVRLGGSDRTTLGEKGASIAALIDAGLPVPAGFAVPARSDVAGELTVDAAVAALEVELGAGLGRPDAPLFFAVRGSPVHDVPGPGEEPFIIGWSRAVAVAQAAQFGAAWAFGAWGRALRRYAAGVLQVPAFRFQAAEAATDPEQQVRLTLSAIDDAGVTVPEDPKQQLAAAVAAIQAGFHTARARWLRKRHQVPEDSGLAVLVQQARFGDRDARSGCGHVYTRDPKAGEAGVTGEYWPQSATSTGESSPLGDALPPALAALAAQLERSERAPLEIGFVLESGEVFLTSVAPANLSAHAALRAAVDMVHEGLISEQEALLRIDPDRLELVLRPVIAPGAKRKLLAKGLDASPGAATGRVVFTAQDAQSMFEAGESAILVRLDTSPEDIQGMTVAAGILTARGGQTSHAAVFARGVGRPAVVGCTELHVDYYRQLFYAGDMVVRRGDWITIDGATGEVMEGRVEMLAPTGSGPLAELLAWADQRSRLEVRANADTARDALKARELGARGVGLCRTEHMFFQPEALRAIRRVIVAEDPRSRQLALNDILPMQRSAFRDILKIMEGLPVTVRLLDLPLHEFLPDRSEDISDVAQSLGVGQQALQARLQQLHEKNPMLGHRGVRLGITLPEVYKTQVRALFEAACQLAREGVRVHPEVLIPFVSDVAEMATMRELVVETAEAVIEEYASGDVGFSLPVIVGSMIEVPRAALLADRLSRHADFFSFGTNDLTQFVHALSRDDMGRFFQVYQQQGLAGESPLAAFDVDGVGQVVEMGVKRGRSTRPGLQMGVCGEHGGDVGGIRFFHQVGLDYVSCSPYRVPVARLAAAHAAIR
jgi:pyruvate,orthophosphate dikinase